MDKDNEKLPVKSPEGEPPKEKKIRITFKENHVISKDGFSKIYHEFPHKVKFKGKGHEAEYVRNLLYCYKEWAYRLFPNLAYEDVIARISKTFGSKKRVRDELTQIREMERERVLRAKLGDEGFEALKVQEKEQEELIDKAHPEQNDVAGASELVRQRLQDLSPEHVGADDSGSDLELDLEHQKNEKHAASVNDKEIEQAQLKERMERNRQLALQRLQEARRLEEEALIAAQYEMQESAMNYDDDEVSEMERIMEEESR